MSLKERHVRATTDFLAAKNVEIENAVNATCFWSFRVEGLGFREGLG